MNCIIILLVALVKPHCEFILYLKVYNVKETDCNGSRHSPKGGHRAMYGGIEV